MTNMFGDTVKACSTAVLLVLLGVFCLFPSSVYAQCSSPTAVQGAQEWFGARNTYAVCVGTEWLDLTCKDVPGCTPTSAAYENRLTDATNLVTIADSAFNDDQSNLVVLDQWAGVVVLTVGSPPSAPTYAGKVTGAAYNDGNDIEVYGDYAFSTARGNTQLVSTDISTPSSPSQSDTVSSSPTNEMTNIWGLGLTYDGQYAITASWQSGSNNECHVHVIDISDPTNMSEVGHTDFSGVAGAGIYCTDVVVWGDYAFLSFSDGGTSGGVGVVDISTKSSPSAVAYASLTTGNQPENIDISDDGKFVFTSNRGDASVSSFDVSDPTSPSYSDNYQNTSFLDDAYRLDVSGDTLVVTGELDDGLVVLDVSDPTNMTYIDDYSSGTNINGAYSVSIRGRYVYVGGRAGNTMAVFDLGCDASPSCNSLTACSNAAEVEWDAAESAYKFCDGSNWQEVGCNSDCPTNLGTCSNTGRIRYRTADGMLMYCDGSNWQPMADVGSAGSGSACSASGIGTTCSDGTVYAGLTPDGNVPMYTTPADAPGTNTWGANTFAVRGTSDNDTGEQHTIDLVAISTTDHPAAQYCSSLSAHGHDDWYLPAQNEALVIANNKNTGDLSGTFLQNIYITSTEVSQFVVRYIDQFGASPTTGTLSKGDSGYVRCVRK